MTKMQKLGLNAFFLFFCLLIQSASAWSINLYVDTDDTGRYILPESNHSTLLADNLHTDFSHRPLSPAEPEPIPTPGKPSEKEDSKEDNKENQDDDKWSSLHFLFYSDFDFAFKSSKFSIAQFERSVLNRTKISLVVLYHSWKSFLV